jgi:hypothetical protein
MGGSITVLPKQKSWVEGLNEGITPYLQMAFQMMLEKKMGEQQRQKNIEQAQQMMPGAFTQPSYEELSQQRGIPTQGLQYPTLLPPEQREGFYKDVYTKKFGAKIPSQYLKFNPQQAQQYPGMGINFQTGEMEYKVPSPLAPTYIYNPSTGQTEPITTPMGQLISSKAKVITKPETVTREKFEAEQTEKKIQLEQKSQFIKDSAQDALNTIGEVEKGIRNFGLFGNVPKIYGTPEYTWKTNVDKLLSGKMIDLMTQMKEASKTGATGFGQLTEKEGQILREASTALKKGLAPEKAQEYLNNMKAALQKVMTGNQSNQPQNDMSQMSDEELRRIAGGG